MAQEPSLPTQIKAEASTLITPLMAIAWRVLDAEYVPHAFGNWYIDLSRGEISLRLVKDRSQYMVSGPPADELRAAGLWKAYDSFADFQNAVLHWSTTHP